MSAHQNPISEQSIAPPYEFIGARLLQGKVIPFLGAGASLGRRDPLSEWTPNSDFLPRADELATHLERQSSFPIGEVADLARVAQYFHGVTGPAGLNDELHGIFSKSYAPSSLHYYLAEFPTNLLIVTTNYDDLLECAFKERRRAFDLVVYNTASQTFSLRYHDQNDLFEVEPEDVRFASPHTPNTDGPPHQDAPERSNLDLSKASVIYKMHGTTYPADPEHDSYVITEDDYVDFLARMASKTAIPSSFAESFRRSHFLFLGYGLRDWNLRVILHKIWKDWPRRYASWAIQYKTSRLEREFWHKRDLMIYEMTIDEFLKNLPKV